MTQVEFAKQVGIATSTISEWKKKKTNPAADKIMNICNVLQITPEQLLTGKGIEDEEEIRKSIDVMNENFITEKDIKNFVIYKGQKFEADVAYIDIYQQAAKSFMMEHFYLSNSSIV